MVKVSLMTNEDFSQCSSCLKNNEETNIYKVEIGKTPQNVSVVKLCNECLLELDKQITAIVNTNNEITVRVIQYNELDAVQELDELSGNNVYDMIVDYEEEVADYEYAWGAFLGDKLIGYCTIGGADEYDDFAEYKNGDLCLSDVFIREEYRGNGYGSILVEESLKQYSEPGNAFADILDVELLHFYEPLGFVSLGEFCETIYKKRTSDKNADLSTFVKSESNREEAYKDLSLEELFAELDKDYE